jgi:hypothetical protein
VTFRFRPRYRGVAWTSIAVGGSLSAIATLVGVISVPLAAGAVGVLLGAAYLASSTWKLRVVADEVGFEVGTAARARFRLTWAEVAKVIVSPTTHTCFVDGGDPSRSLIVPGVGAPAPYDIENRAALVGFILAHVSSDRIQTVETLESVHRVGHGVTGSSRPDSAG